ncbi:MAG TPA: hypothetical protein VK926_02905 [Gaiellaceae bacterium]|nr:hypothetical protein [Gaiellaceae bacterium]
MIDCLAAIMYVGGGRCNRDNPQLGNREELEPEAPHTAAAPQRDE